ncbi:MAG: VCBS repeat-containing protein [Gemmataceae bacterium]|nr:VCBS repeat-containing protein [Gemmataceae bacterium]
MPARRSAILAVTALEDRTTPVNLDTTFGTGGFLVDVSSPSAGKLSLNLGQGTAAVRPDGTLLGVFRGQTYDPVAGVLVPELAVARFGADGRLDPAAGASAVTLVPYPAGLGVETLDYVSFQSADPVAGGGFLVRLLLQHSTGNSLDPFVNSIVFIRLLPDGRGDAVYGSGGAVVLPYTKPANGLVGPFGVADQYLVGPDGRVVAVGLRSGGVAAVTVLNPDGSPDTRVGPGGTRQVPLPLPTLLAAALAPDGKLILSGTNVAQGFGPQSAIATFVMRLGTDGSPDPTFADGGVYGPAADTARADLLAVRPDGSVVYAGGVDPKGGLNDPAYLSVGQLTPSGRPDPGFGGGDGQVVYLADQFTQGFYGLIVMPDGRLAVPCNLGVKIGDGLIVLNPDGSPDRSVGPGGAVVLTSNYYFQPQPPTFVLRAAVAPANRLVLDNSNWVVAIDLTAPNPASNPVPPLTEFVPTVPPPAPFGVPARVLAADLTGDGRPDAVEYAQAGGPARVRVTDGATGQVVADGPVYESGFTGGVFAATADFDRDGKAELIVSPDVGGGARVQVLSLADGRLVVRDNFFAIDDPQFRGGARVAAGDVNGDGVPDLVVAAGFGGGPRVAIYDGTGLLQGAAALPKLVGDFFAFPGDDAARLRNGAFVAAGDLDGDGRADLAFGGGPGGGPRVYVLSGALVAAGRVADAQAGPIANFFVDDDPLPRGGVWLAAADLDGDGTTDLAALRLDLPGTQGVRVYPSQAVRQAGARAPAADSNPDRLKAAGALLTGGATG